MSEETSTIAVFDLDGTITYNDTFLEFIKYFKGSIRFYLGIVLMSPYILLFYLKLYTNTQLKELFFSHYFREQTATDIQQKGIEFSVNIIPKLCRESAINVLNWHINQKHDILILSASSDIWLKSWCLLNNFELIATTFEVEGNQYTGKIKGRNCYGIQKKKLLAEFLAKNNYNYSYGYGDSKADQYFLDLINQAYLMKLNQKNVDKYWSPASKI